MNTIEELKKVLHALESFHEGRKNHAMMWQVEQITRLRSIIEQLEKSEPRLMMNPRTSDSCSVFDHKIYNSLAYYTVPLYTHPIMSDKPDVVGRCLLNAAFNSGDEGAIRLAAQLIGEAPCPDCDYRKEYCKCDR